MNPINQTHNNQNLYINPENEKEEFSFDTLVSHLKENLLNPTEVISLIKKII